MYARGMTVREIQGHLRELYAVDVSPDLISRVTDAVLDEVREWQNRPLDAIYPVIFLRCATGQDPRRERGQEQGRTDVDRCRRFLFRRFRIGAICPVTEPTFSQSPSLQASHGAVGFCASENSLMR